MRRWIFIISGTFLMAVGLNGFLAPHNLVTGGATGIALIILRLLNIPMWLTNIIINVPLLSASVKLKGFRYTKYTLYSTFLLSFFMGLTENLNYPDMDVLLGSVFGGLITGAGLGLVLRGNATTGGSDLAADLVRIYLPHISISRLMMFFDVAIILAGLYVLGAEPVLYAIISVYIISKTIDAVLEGLDFAKAAFIISDNAADIGTAITQKLKRGATMFDGTGMYTQTQKNMLVVVMASREISKLKSVINEIDSSCFVFISDVREIMGDFR